jgi:hypothetical protein
MSKATSKKKKLKRVCAEQPVPVTPYEPKRYHTHEDLYRTNNPEGSTPILDMLRRAERYPFNK